MIHMIFMQSGRTLNVGYAKHIIKPLYDNKRLLNSLFMQFSFIMYYSVIMYHFLFTLTQSPAKPIKCTQYTE